MPYWNCARITQLRDGRLAIVADLINEANESRGENFLFFSSDDGATWTDPVWTPAAGIVPDKLLELASGRWILSCHDKEPDTGFLEQRLWYSDDQGATWSDPVIVATAGGAESVRGLHPGDRRHAGRLPPGKLRPGMGLLQDPVVATRARPGGIRSVSRFRAATDPFPGFSMTAAS